MPALLRWPRGIAGGRAVDTVCSTLDYLPTIADFVGVDLTSGPDLDGVSILPILRGETAERSRPLPYRFLAPREQMFGSPTFAVIEGTLKYLTNLTDSTDADLCFDINLDMEEKNNMAGSERGRCAAMRGYLEDFLASARRSHQGRDYEEPWEPVTAFQEPSDW